MKRLGVVSPDVVNFVVVAVTILGFIVGIFVVIHLTAGPAGPKTVCLRAHDVYHYNGGDYHQWDVKSVCDETGVVYPGTTPTPSPNSTSSAVPVN